MNKRTNKFPKGWTEGRVRGVLKHYERQSESAAVEEDEAAYKHRKETIMIVPVKLVPAVRELITRRSK
jgi:hypothetical protein